MKGYKSIIFYTVIGGIGLVTALEGLDVKGILLPLACHVDPAAVIADGNACVDTVIKLAGLWTAGIAAAGGVLRAVTTTAIFKGLKD